MKNMALTLNRFERATPTLAEKNMNCLVREKDYQAISDRLTEMEPMAAANWLAAQPEQLRFAVACLMEPEKAKPIFACEEQTPSRPAI